MTLYIGPGMSAGALALTIIILALIVLALGYLLWFKIKRIFRRK